MANRVDCGDEIGEMHRRWRITVKAKDVKPYERNPRRLAEDGYHQRIIATKDLRVMGGHQRIRASKELGVKEIAVLLNGG